MAEPVLLIVDNDPETFHLIEEDVRSEYGGRFQVLRAESGAAAFEILQELQQRNESLALLLIRQQLPQTSIAAFFKQAAELFPTAKRILYATDADTAVAPDPLHHVEIDSYLLKPWDEPEACLYPVIENVLEEWQATFHPPLQQVRIICQRWSPRAHEVRDFLARNRVPYQFIDIETDEEARYLVERANPNEQRFPLLFFPDGSYLAAPSEREIAEKIGYRTEPERALYDLVIVGGGPAGLAAAVYGASEGLRTIIVERETPGGQAGMSPRIENYVGFPEGLSGGDLARRTVEQAKRFGAEILVARKATGIRAENEYQLVILEDGSELLCSAVLIASGVAYRTLDVPGADRLTGAGVYYGTAHAEAFAYRGQDICLLGGGNSAGQAAMLLAKYARTVAILTRTASLADSMSQYLVDRITATENIKVRPHSTVVEVHGEEHLEAITVKHSETGEVERVPTTGLFVWIGASPHTDWLADMVERDEAGFILSGFDLTRNGKRPKGWPLDRDPYPLETSVPGIFVAGDVRCGSVKRVTSAIGEGSMAIQFIHQYLSDR
jgi:thioredoxin reductase (NADPH)